MVALLDTGVLVKLAKEPRPPEQVREPDIGILLFTL
jgi:hypothetical protein